MGMKEDVFGQDGMLHTLIGDKYELREGQMRMAIAVARAMMLRNHLLCEGATGIGKSFGYLIPAFSPATRQVRAIVEEGNRPIILSTSTKILQDQLIETDVPVVSKATGVDIKVYVAKGRNNYLSLRRLKNFQSQLENDSIGFATADAVKKIVFQAEALEKWWYSNLETYPYPKVDGEFGNFTREIYDQLLETETDPSEVDLFEVHPEVSSSVQSDRNDCLGKACPTYEPCPYYTKRCQMDDADLIISNHTLLAYHLRYRNVLPEARTYIIDEAHKFYQAVSDAFEIDISLQRVSSFLKTFLSRWNILRKTANALDIDVIKRELEQFALMANQTSDLASQFFDEYHQMLQDAALEQRIISERTSGYAYAVATPFREKADAFVSELEKYVRRCDKFAETHFEAYIGDMEADIDEEELDSSHVSNDLLKDYQYYLIIRKSAENITAEASTILSQTSPNIYCYWSDIAKSTSKEGIDGGRVKLLRTPIDITKYLEPLFASGNSVIMTSATLTTGKQGFNRLKTQLGLQDYQNVKEMVEPSPFPFGQNAEIHLFSDLLQPKRSTDPPAEQEAYFSTTGSIVRVLSQIASRTCPYSLHQ